MCIRDSSHISIRKIVLNDLVWLGRDALPPAMVEPAGVFMVFQERSGQSRIDNTRTGNDTLPKVTVQQAGPCAACRGLVLSLIHISEPTRLLSISYAVFCLKKKKL